MFLINKLNYIILKFYYNLINKNILVLILLIVIPLNSKEIKFTYGHISSFFKQSERPVEIENYRNNNNQINIKKVYKNLLKLNFNYFAYGLWATEERSIYSWSNFINLASKLQKDKPNISLLVYVRSPDYGKNKHFCWDEQIDKGICKKQTQYNNYLMWAKKVAQLHNKFPIIKGILIDDFIYGISDDDSDNRLFSPSYLLKIKHEAQKYYPKFIIDAIFYQRIISVYHAKRFENSLDGILFFYRHFDTNETRIDPNPTRIKDEIEMFSRCYTYNNISPLATIYRKPNYSSHKNNKLILNGTINISKLSSDIKIVYWDNINDKTVRGYAKIKLFLNKKVILEQDIAEGESDNSLQIFTIPYSQFKNIASKNISLKLEIITTKNFSRWSYLCNLFILKPKYIPIKWEILKDDDNSHILTTSKDLKRSVKKYIGIYAGPHSKFNVNINYVQTLLKYSLEAVKQKKIDGIILWEIMMNKTSSEIFKSFNKF